jgi:hypothetical protein
MSRVLPNVAEYREADDEGSITAADGSVEMTSNWAIMDWY